MPAELSVLQVAGLVDKLGTIGVLLAIIGWLVWDRLRLVKQGARTFRQRDRWRQIAERFRGAILAAGAQIPSIDDIDKEFALEKED